MSVLARLPNVVSDNKSRKGSVSAQHTVACTTLGLHTESSQSSVSATVLFVSLKFGITVG